MQLWNMQTQLEFPDRLSYAMVTFDAAVQFNLPVVEAQTHNAFHAEKFCVHMRVLGINNQWTGHGGKQHNYRGISITGTVRNLRLTAQCQHIITKNCASNFGV
eukprot:IDg571t1